MSSHSLSATGMSWEAITAWQSSGPDAQPHSLYKLPQPTHSLYMLNDTKMVKMMILVMVMVVVVVVIVVMLVMVMVMCVVIVMVAMWMWLVVVAVLKTMVVMIAMNIVMTLEWQR